MYEDTIEDECQSKWTAFWIRWIISEGAMFPLPLQSWWPPSDAEPHVIFPTFVSFLSQFCWPTRFINLCSDVSTSPNQTARSGETGTFPSPPVIHFLSSGSATIAALSSFLQHYPLLILSAEKFLPLTMKNGERDKESYSLQNPLFGQLAWIQDLAAPLCAWTKWHLSRLFRYKPILLSRHKHNVVWQFIG